MSSIRNMMRQANPEADEQPAAKSAPATPRSRKSADSHANRGEEKSAPRPLQLPSAPPIEERKPWSTRLKPSLKKSLESYVQEIRDAGFSVTQEMVLDALLRELRDDDTLRNRIASTIVGELASER